jgi:hypothetical protein
MFRRAFLAVFLGALLFVSPSPSALAGGADKEQANKSEQQKGEEAKPKAETDKPAREDKGEAEGERFNDGRNESEDEDEGYDGRHHRGRYGHGRYGYGHGYGYYYEEPPDPSHFHARMSGDQEVKKGAAGGKGLARLDVDSYEHRVCFELAYEGIGKPTGAHIHRGGRGENGPVVVDLHFARHGNRGCVPGNPHVLRDMQAQPQHYYVNLHNAEFPDGAIRGQVDYPTG